MHRLCKIAGLHASHAKKKGKAGKPGPAVHDDLLAVVDERGKVRHDFTATAVNQKWLTNITEHPTGEGKLYLCAIKDCCSNKIVDYSIHSRKKSALAASAIRNLIALRSPVDTILHSDRGSQFRSKKVVWPLKNKGLVGSMGLVGSSGDNAAMESLLPAAEERPGHQAMGDKGGAAPRDRGLDRNQVQPPPFSPARPGQAHSGRV